MIGVSPQAGSVPMTPGGLNRVARSGTSALGIVKRSGRGAARLSTDAGERESTNTSADPQYIKDILVTHNRNFTKSRGLERSKRVLGNGLTSEGAVHLRQRRLMQPAFHRDRIAG